MLLVVQLVLPEAASADLERLLAIQTCPVHPGTTLDAGDCEISPLGPADECDFCGHRPHVGQCVAGTFAICGCDR
jgi:hypothetical protein